MKKVFAILMMILATGVLFLGFLAIDNPSDNRLATSIIYFGSLLFAAKLFEIVYQCISTSNKNNIDS